MQIQLLMTGSELMSGTTIDSNSARIADALAQQGLGVYRKVTVGDDRDLLVAEIRSLSAASDVLLVNGGLGPTSDDLTAEALALAAGDTLALHPEALAHLTGWEVELVTNLAKFRRGQKPGKTNYTPAEINAQNARWQAESQSRSLVQVRADYQGVRKQTIRQVEALSAAELDAPRAWLGQASIRQWVLTWVVEHEQEHAHLLTEWRRQTGQSVQE